MSQPPEDEAKARARELHGLIKDAKQATREFQQQRALLAQDINTALNAFSQQGALMLAAVGGDHCDTLNEFLKEYLAETTAAVEESSARIVQRAAELTAMADQEAFLAEVIHGVGIIVIPEIDERFAEIEKEILPALVRKTIVEMLRKQRKPSPPQREPSPPEKPKLPPASLPAHVPGAFMRLRVSDE